MEWIELQSTEQGCKNGAKRVRRPLQQIVFGTQQAQQAIDDGDERGVINNDALSLTGAFTSLRVSPPCKEQRRLAIVVAVETLPFLTGGSFCVKGRNCALYVCCEGKNFRVICSHLNPFECGTFIRGRLG